MVKKLSTYLLGAALALICSLAVATSSIVAPLSDEYEVVYRCQNDCVLVLLPTGKYGVKDSEGGWVTTTVRKLKDTIKTPGFSF
ncbi:hypothetical protein HNR48_001494 [Pseudoteredinibacter isoporae]|uniref:DUF1496 domain-containing protein n=1 Tax=Pseudoteredinibacter isoporae TaxID=570281 RepID=A0A7X0JTP8_9GAMM|nr:hypothetical protein [Pseudoteredinibacter isoporae]